MSPLFSLTVSFISNVKGTFSVSLGRHLKRLFDINPGNEDRGLFASLSEQNRLGGTEGKGPGAEDVNSAAANDTGEGTAACAA